MMSSCHYVLLCQSVAACPFWKVGPLKITGNETPEQVFESLVCGFGLCFLLGSLGIFATFFFLPSAHPAYPLAWRQYCCTVLRL